MDLDCKWICEENSKYKRKKKKLLATNNNTSLSSLISPTSLSSPSICNNPSTMTTTSCPSPLLSLPPLQDVLARDPQRKIRFYSVKERKILMFLPPSPSDFILIKEHTDLSGMSSISRPYHLHSSYSIITLPHPSWSCIQSLCLSSASVPFYFLPSKFPFLPSSLSPPNSFLTYLKVRMEWSALCMTSTAPSIAMTFLREELSLWRLMLIVCSPPFDIVRKRRREEWKREDSTTWET